MRTQCGHGESIYLAANNVAFIVLLKAHFIQGPQSRRRKTRIIGERPNMGMGSTMEIFNGQGQALRSFGAAKRIKRVYSSNPQAALDRHG